MSNFKKTSELTAIRLPKQASLPTTRELIDMANESKRSRKRVELPWKPERRPEPVVLSVHHESQKSNWTLHTSQRSDAEVVWSAVDADPTKVLLALRDWFTDARVKEGWGRPDDQLPPIPTSVAAQPAPESPAVGAGGPYPFHFMVPPAYPYPVGTVPPHWTQYPVPTPQAYPMQPLTPEQWAAAYAAAALPLVPMLGDLLVSAGIIPTPALQAALTLQNTAPSERRKIGEILVTSGALNRNVVAAAVTLQDLARRGVISNSRVTDLLRQSFMTGSSVEQLLGLPIKAAMPPELQQLDSKQAESKSQSKSNPLWQDRPRVERPVSPPSQFRRTDDLIEEESRVSESDRQKLRRVMDLIKKADLSADGANERAQQLIDLFIKAGILTENILQEFARGGESAADNLKALLVKEKIDPTTFDAGLGCRVLLNDKRLRIEQAIIALGYCQRSRVSLNDAISEMGWDVNTDDI